MTAPSTRPVASLQPIPLGIACGVVAAAGIVFMTVRAAQVQGGNTLLLLRKFLPGYSISVAGCVAGMIWAFVEAFLVAVLVAALYNALVRLLEPRR
jgi:hypothetical protein